MFSFSLPRRDFFFVKILYIYSLFCSNYYSFQVLMQFHKYVRIKKHYWLMTWLSAICEAYSTQKYLYSSLKSVLIKVFLKQTFESTR